MRNTQIRHSSKIIAFSGKQNSILTFVKHWLVYDISNAPNGHDNNKQGRRRQKRRRRKKTATRYDNNDINDNDDDDEKRDNDDREVEEKKYDNDL